MKFPSIKLLAQDTFGVLKRFPLEVLSALTGTISATIVIRSQFHDYKFDSSFYIRIIMAASLSLLLNLSTTLFTGSKQITGIIKWLWHLGACAIIIGLFFILNPFDNGTADLIRFCMVNLGFHLLVSIAAFIFIKQINGFWQFNKTLFLRFLASILYGGVLFIGLAGAMSALNFLFNAHFESVAFSTLWVWIAGVFTTIFFLAGIPENLSTLEQDNSYPKALKIFTQYVLIPLATVYVIILLSYEGKILIEWRLPKGMVSNIILGYAVFGILSLLLVYPIRNLEENKWLKSFARYFYFLMVPLIVLLFLAVGVRISKYGVTEYRYFLILLSCWLFFITIYFLISKKQNIKLIPMSLCILTLLSVYGPQSAFSVSQYSQRKELINLFKKYSAFRDGKLVSLENKTVSKKDGNRAVSTLEYLIDDHDFNFLQPYFNRDLKLISDSLSMQKDKSGKIISVDKWSLKNKKLNWTKEYLGLAKFNSSRYSEDNDTAKTTFRTITLNADASNVHYVKGYDYTLDEMSYQKDTLNDSYANIKFKRFKDEAKGIYTLVINNEKVSFNINQIVSQLIKNKTINLDTEYDPPQEMLILNGATTSYNVSFKIGYARFSISDSNTIKPDVVNGTYYIKVKSTANLK